MNMKFEIVENKLQIQIWMIKSLDSELNEKINSEKFIQIKNQVTSNIYKM